MTYHISNHRFALVTVAVFLVIRIALALNPGYRHDRLPEDHRLDDGE